MCELALVDSILEPMAPLQVLMQESKYKGDIFDALRMMHLGDSAVFILDADTFYQYYMQGLTKDFDQKDLYVTFKLQELMPKEEVDAYMKAMEEQYNAYVEQGRAEEASLLQEYITKNKIKVAPTESGLYFIPKKAGKGAKAVVGQRVFVHYTFRKWSMASIVSSLVPMPGPRAITLNLRLRLIDVVHKSLLSGSKSASGHAVCIITLELAGA